MSQQRVGSPRLASFEVGHGSSNSSQELLAEVEEEISRRRRHSDANISFPQFERLPLRKFKLNVVESSSSNEELESDDDKEVDRQTEIILAKERFEDFFHGSGLHAFVHECFEDAFRDGQFDRGVGQEDFIKTYFITPKIPGVAVQARRSLHWKLLAEKCQLREEYAKLRHDKSMQDHGEHTPTPTTGTEGSVGPPPTSGGGLAVGEHENNTATAKCPFGFVPDSSAEYKWTEEEFTFDEFEFFYADKFYDYEVMHDAGEGRAKASIVNKETGPVIPAMDNSASNLKAKDKGHLNSASSKSALDKDGVKSAKSRNPSSEKEGHTVAGVKHC